MFFFSDVWTRVTQAGIVKKLCGDILMARNRVTVNGVTIEVEGKNVSVRNGTVYVDGQEVYNFHNATGYARKIGSQHILWEGEVANLCCNGNVTCGNVYGDVQALGNIRCGDVDGNVGAHGNVSAGSCSGNIIAGGSVRVN